MSYGDRPNWKRRALDAEHNLTYLRRCLSACVESTVAITPAEAERLLRGSDSSHRETQPETIGGRRNDN